jgi:hypothetical protein
MRRGGGDSRGASLSSAHSTGSKRKNIVMLEPDSIKYVVEREFILYTIFAMY